MSSFTKFLLCFAVTFILLACSYDKKEKASVKDEQPKEYSSSVSVHDGGENIKAKNGKDGKPGFIGGNGEDGQDVTIEQ